MTTPDSIAGIDPDIAHLIQDPVCEVGSRHSGSRPRADFWVDMHGCQSLLLCGPCLVRNRHILDGWVLNGKTLGCEGCGHDFPSFDAMIKVVPL